MAAEELSGWRVTPGSVHALKLRTALCPAVSAIKFLPFIPPLSSCTPRNVGRASLLEEYYYALRTKHSRARASFIGEFSWQTEDIKSRCRGRENARRLSSHFIVFPVVHPCVSQTDSHARTAKSTISFRLYTRKRGGSLYPPEATGCLAVIDTPVVYADRTTPERNIAPIARAPIFFSDPCSRLQNESVHLASSAHTAGVCLNNSSDIEHEKIPPGSHLLKLRFSLRFPLQVHPVSPPPTTAIITLISIKTLKSL